MLCLVQRGSSAAAFLRVFDSVLVASVAGRPLQRCRNGSVSSASKSQGLRAGHSEIDGSFREQGSAGLAWQAPVCAWFWVTLLLKLLCWPSERMESFSVLGWRALPS